MTGEGTPLTPEEIQKAINRLKNEKGPGHGDTDPDVDAFLSKKPKGKAPAIPPKPSEAGS
jgi:hypothetical protein